MPDTNEVQRLPQVIGCNVQRIRLGAGVSMDRLAAEVYGCGLRTWNSGNVAKMESGRHVSTLPTLLILCSALSNVAGRDIGLTELVGHDGNVQLNDSITVSGRALAASVGTVPLQLGDGEPPAGLLCEQRTAKRLGLSRQDVVDHSTALWGHSFEAERDRRAGADANRQRKAQATRHMEDELAQHIRNNPESGEADA